MTGNNFSNFLMKLWTIADPAVSTRPSKYHCRALWSVFRKSYLKIGLIILISAYSAWQKFLQNNRYLRKVEGDENYFSKIDTSHCFTPAHKVFCRKIHYPTFSEQSKSSGYFYQARQQCLCENISFAGLELFCSLNC